MADLNESPLWVDGIYQLELSDPVLGGPGGIANRQAEQLASRTVYLKQQVEAVGGGLQDHQAAADPHSQYAPKASPTFTGEPKAPTPGAGDATTRLANTQFVADAVATRAPINSPAFAGQPTAPTRPAGTSDTTLATTEFVATAIGSGYGTIRQPQGVTPAAGALGVSTTVTLTAGAYYSLYGVAQAGAQFQVSKQQDFAAQIVADSGWLGAVTSWAVSPALAASTAYYWRVRYKDAEGVVSPWSVVIAFNTGAVSLARPSITSPTAGQTGVSLTPTITSSAFSVTGGADTHASSDWQISTGIDGTGAMLYSRTADTVNKTSLTIPDGTLTPNATYYVRVRHNGTTLGPSVWSPSIVFTTQAVINQPSITSPAANAVNVVLTPTLTSRAFAVTGGADTHASSDWQIWTGANGTGSKVHEVLADIVNKTSLTIPASTLTPNTVYYARVRHNGATLPASAWSADGVFTTGAVTAPVITSPTNGATGIGETPTLTTNPFSASATDTHVSTDWQIWTGAGATGTKLWESLADSVNKISITVPAATLVANAVHYLRVRHKGQNYGDSLWSEESFTTVTQFIPTVLGTAFGGGYYYGKIKIGSDTYALIVAPKSAETTLAYKTSSTADTGVSSLVDGWTNTNAINDAAHPAAQYCRAYRGGGFDDWYLGARDEMEPAYRNLKPAVSDNITSNRLDGVANGTNSSSVPAGATYTLTSPAKTTSSLFVGSEAFYSGSDQAGYWTSSQNDFGDPGVIAISAWRYYMNNGLQYMTGKANALRVRPIRRVKIG